MERSDPLTLVAISALAYVVAVGLHEHAGHAVACVALGGRLRELGAFYVDCDNTAIGELGTRLVALAGPLVSLLTGIISLAVFERLPEGPRVARYFFWLLGAVALMSAAGYPLFSGISGLGDFGGSPDGAIYRFEPPWLWRTGLTIFGALAYLFAVWIAVRAIDPHVPGSGSARIGVLRRLLLTSYLSGGGVSLLIGLLNPHGAEIVITSALAGSMGATSALLWMMFWLNRRRAVAQGDLGFERHWGWIGFSLVVTVLYGAVFGPTVHP